jgi:hypothetical protein
MRTRLTFIGAIALTLSLGGTAFAQSRVRGGSAAPLTDEARRIAEAIPDENTAPPGEHYYRSNEWRQDLLVPKLAGLGGAYVGVGSDQNYTMAAMANAEVLFLVDYDPYIPWIHAIYEALILESETPEALIARFAEENEAETRAILERRFAGKPRAARMVRHFRGLRAAWHAYLGRVAGLVRDGRPFSWLSSPEMYAYIRGMFQNGRVFYRNGDVTADRTMQAVADACRRMGLEVRVVYFSNAEQFFEYTDQFIENMRALPTGERSVVLRTIRHRSIPIAADGRWHWLVQDFSDFRARLDTGVYRRSFAFTTDLLAAGPPHLGEDGLSTMDASVPRAVIEQARERRARR